MIVLSSFLLRSWKVRNHQTSKMSLENEQRNINISLMFLRLQTQEWPITMQTHRLLPNFLRLQTGSSKVWPMTQCPQVPHSVIRLHRLLERGRKIAYACHRRAWQQEHTRTASWTFGSSVCIMTDLSGHLLHAQSL